MQQQRQQQLDIEGIVNILALAGGGKGKGQFETTEEYAARRLKSLEKIQRSNAFRLTDVASYDADQGVATFDLSTSIKGRFLSSSDEKDASGDYLTVSLKSKLIHQSTYVGRNGFGASANILRKRYSEYGLVLRTDGPVKLKDGMTISFPLERSDAMRNLANLRVFLVGEIVAAAIYEGADSIEPTISTPLDVRTSASLVPFRVDKILVRDIRTGRIVHSIEGEE